jgi:predicted nuclease of predicted toxin-antitoxin system
MDFLLDVNITPSLISLLEKDSHNCRHAVSLGMGTSSDEEIVDFARQSGEVIITHDLDFGTIMVFSGENKPSVIIFRIHLISPLVFFNLIKLNLSRIEESLRQGAIVVFEESNVRIRLLPST